METHVLLTLVISAIAFILIFSGKVHRAISVGGALMALLVVGKYYGFLDGLGVVFWTSTSP